MPSSRRQIWATALALPAVRVKVGNAARPFNEELHALVLAERGQLMRALTRREGRRGHGQWRDAPGDLASHAEGALAGGQDAQMGRGGQERLRQPRHAGGEMFAVVEHKQQPPVSQPTRQGFSGRSCLAFGDPQRGRNGRADQRRIGHRAEIHPPDAVGEARLQVGQSLPRQARFADPARSGQRDEPVAGEQLAHMGQFRAAAHQAGWRREYRPPGGERGMIGAGSGSVGGGLLQRGLIGGTRLSVRGGRQLAAQGRLAGGEGAHDVDPVAVLGVQPHQPAVHPLIQRVGLQQAHGVMERPVDVAGVFLQIGQPLRGAQAGLAQPLAERRDPIVIAIGEQVARVDIQRAGQGDAFGPGVIRLPGRGGAGERGLEIAHIAGDGRVGPPAYFVAGHREPTVAFGERSASRKRCSRVRRLLRACPSGVSGQKAKASCWREISASRCNSR